LCRKDLGEESGTARSDSIVSKQIMAATRNECGERLSGSPASFSRRFIMRQTSLP
jgi:hypothetical protein